jgi:hypothetical protein
VLFVMQHADLGGQNMRAQIYDVDLISDPPCSSAFNEGGRSDMIDL